jgi:hypothetical protein
MPHVVVRIGEGDDLQRLTVQRPPLDAFPEELPEVGLAAAQRRWLRTGWRRRRERLQRALAPSPTGRDVGTLVFAPMVEVACPAASLMTYQPPRERPSAWLAGSPTGDSTWAWGWRRRRAGAPG